jgi:enediyne biosynthesis protein E4
MMDMGWILLIIKIQNNYRHMLEINFLNTLILMTIFFSTSCAQKKIFINSDPVIENIKNSAKTLVKNKIISGPTSLPVTHDFEDQTRQYGLDNIKASNLYAVDFNSDGDTDLVVLPDHYSVPLFYAYIAQTSRFEKISYNPLPEMIRGSYLSFLDFNKDGVLDLVIGTLNQKTELTKYPLRFFKGTIKRNLIHYNEVGANLSKGIRPTASISFFDFDLDGYLDLYEGNWYEYKESKSKPIHDQLYKGKEFHFLNATGFLYQETKYSRNQKRYINATPSFGVSTCDIDQNGYPDVMVSSSSGFTNKLWLNLKNTESKGQRLFKNYGNQSEFAADFDGKYSERGGGNSFYSLCSDYNNDGIIDIVVGELTHSYDTEYRDRSAFLTGTTHSFPPKFLRTEYYTDTGNGAWDQGDRRGVFFDYDMDGLIDLLVDNSGFPPKSRLILFRQEENHAFVDLSEKMGVNILNPSGTITIDINKDGQMDFITGQTTIRNSAIDSKLYVFINKVIRDRKRSIRFHLKGDLANLQGLGAMIKLQTNKRKMMKWNETLSGPLPSQNEAGVYFGFDEDKAQSVEVRWPILYKDSKTPLVRTYDLRKYRLKKHYELTLCESGAVIEGIEDCSKKIELIK